MSFLIDILEFLHHVSLVLGINHHAFPHSLPRRLLTLIQRDKQFSKSDDAYCSVLVEFRDVILSSKSGTFNADTPLALFSKHQFDERSNAAFGLALSSNRDLYAIRGRLAELAMNWKPHSETQPSTMEYLTAARLMTGLDFNRLPKPNPSIIPVEVISGFIMSHRRSYNIACETLTRCVE